MTRAHAIICTLTETAFSPRALDGISLREPTRTPKPHPRPKTSNIWQSLKSFGGSVSKAVDSVLAAPPYPTAPEADMLPVSQSAVDRLQLDPNAVPADPNDTSLRARLNRGVPSNPLRRVRPWTVAGRPSRDSTEFSPQRTWSKTGSFNHRSLLPRVDPAPGTVPRPPKRKARRRRSAQLDSTQSETLAGLLLEMPQISRQGKKVMADDRELKALQMGDVIGNMVVFVADKDTFMCQKGFFLAYFMDSDASAQAVKAGKLPPKIIPDRVRFNINDNPITQVWNKSRSTPGDEAILAIVQGNISDEDKEIYVDKMSTRPGFHRNSMITKLIDYLKDGHPGYVVNFSGPTDKGANFIKKYTGKEWEPAHNENPETHKYRFNRPQKFDEPEKAVAK